MLPLGNLTMRVIEKLSVLCYFRMCFLSATKGWSFKNKYSVVATI